MSLNYESSGVDYGQLDAFKRACQQAAGTTNGALTLHGYKEPAHVRGESAYLVEADDHYLAHVEEGLGTKCLVADAVREAGGKDFYREIGIDTVATIVNDLITCGALPVSVAMHAAVGDSQWFADTHRAFNLVEGFAEGCRQAGAVWGGGETPALRNVVVPSSIALAGSAVGCLKPKSNRITGDVSDGDTMIFLASAGVHTNGLTLCRMIAENHPERYSAKLADGRTYGEALLAPSVVYVKFVRECQKRGLKLNYAVHVTGHGWRKLMRLEEPFVYEVTGVREPCALFDFMMEAGPISREESYATFNMGVGFAVYVKPAIADAVLAAAKDTGYDAWIGGRVRKDGDRKEVSVPSIGIKFGAESLHLR